MKMDENNIMYSTFEWTCSYLCDLKQKKKQEEIEEEKDLNLRHAEMLQIHNL